MKASNTNTIRKYKDSSEGLYPLIDSPKALASEYRRRKNKFDFKSIHPSDVDEEVSNGWTIQYERKRITRLKRLKKHDKWIEDRAWCLFCSMGYPVMNGDSFRMSFVRSNGSTGTKQIDVYGEDQETALVIECKSRKQLGRRSLQKDIQETISLKRIVRTRIGKRFEHKSKPKIVWIYVTNNILWSKSDIERADDGDIKIITQSELQYYETFIKHMGPAGKYQVLGDFLKGQKIPGLSEVRLPAIRGKIGKDTYYSFVTTPRHLLKIAFVNHQALSRDDGRPSYQRMISSSRIREIGKFIRQGGYFPTSILVNFSESLRFDQISNKANTMQTIKFGWITLPTKYRTAWIIDGQHRLYGFSHLEDRYLDQELFILGFEKMSVVKEAQLFITINHEQKSVPKSLLLSVLPFLRRNEDDPSTGLAATESAVILSLDSDEASPLAHRFVKPGLPPESYQNLTISEAVKGLRRSGLIGERVRMNVAAGPLSGSSTEQTVLRATTVLKSYFGSLRDANPKRWTGGKDTFVAVNPGIRAHMVVVGETIRYLSYKKALNFEQIDAEMIAELTVDFCRPIFEYIRDASDEEIRSKFSRKFGEGGVKEYVYNLMQILQKEVPDFGPEDFHRWIEQSESDKIDEVNQFLLKLSEQLTDYVIDTLKEVHGIQQLDSGEPAYWELGVQSSRIRKNTFDMQQQETTRRKPKEAYLNIVDLVEIVKQENNWKFFVEVFNNPMYEERKGKKYYLDWMNQFNEVRKIAAHKNQLRTYSDDDLEFVEWLRTEVYPKVAGC